MDSRKKVQIDFFLNEQQKIKTKAIQKHSIG